MCKYGSLSQHFLKRICPLIEKTNKELETQKDLALQQLETQVDELSQLIKEKLLGKGVAI